MDRDKLDQYIDTCELVKEIEEEIRKIREEGETVVHDVVKGSSHEFPYTGRRFRLEGKPGGQGALLESKLSQLDRQKRKAEELREEVESWMEELPARAQRLIRYRIFEGRSWESISRKMGRRATAESVRKEFERLFEKK